MCGGNSFLCNTQKCSPDTLKHIMIYCNIPHLYHVVFVDAGKEEMKVHIFVISHPFPCTWVLEGAQCLSSKIQDHLVALIRFGKSILCNYGILIFQAL